MFDIGIQEMLVIMVLALIVFGPDKLPELGRRLGRAMREFRRASEDFRRTVETNLHFDEDPTPVPPSATETSGATAGATASIVTDATPAPAHGGLEPVNSAAGTTAGEGEGAAGDVGHVAGEMVEPFWTARGGRLLHRSTCPWRSRVAEAERIPLKTATDGWDMGLASCPSCDPRPVEVAS